MREKKCWFLLYFHSVPCIFSLFIVFVFFWVYSGITGIWVILSALCLLSRLCTLKRRGLRFSSHVSNSFTRISFSHCLCMVVFFHMQKKMRSEKKFSTKLSAVGSKNYNLAQSMSLNSERREKWMLHYFYWYRLKIIRRHKHRYRLEMKMQRGNIWCCYNPQNIHKINFNAIDTHRAIWQTHFTQHTTHA